MKLISCLFFLVSVVSIICLHCLFVYSPLRFGFPYEKPHHHIPYEKPQANRWCRSWLWIPFHQEIMITLWVHLPVQGESSLFVWSLFFFFWGGGGGGKLRGKIGNMCEVRSIVYGLEVGACLNHVIVAKTIYQSMHFYEENPRNLHYPLLQFFGRTQSIGENMCRNLIRNSGGTPSF